MRRSHLATLLTGIVIAATLGATRSSAAPKPVRDLFEQADRKIRIEPEQPTSGIESGIVIAYGHVLKPPYQIEYRAKKLFVNGVQVQPALVAEREHSREQAAMAKLPKSKRPLGELSKTARELYWDRVDKIPMSDLKKEISTLLKKHPDVEEVIWEDDLSLTLRYRGQKVATDAIWFRKTRPKSEPAGAQQARSEKNRQENLEQLRKKLEQGYCLFFTSDGGVHAGPDQRLRVNEIMTDTQLSPGARTEKLMEVFPGSLIPALDVVANYDAKEWAISARVE